MFENCIRKWRIYRGFTLKELSILTNINDQKIRAIELNKRKQVKKEDVKKISKVLKVPINRLMEKCNDI